MGKKNFIIFFIIIFYLQNVAAISSDLKDSYAPKETAIASLTGSILQSISPSQVKLKKGYQNVAFDYDIKQLNGKYYFWFIAPQIAASYSLIIEDIVTNIDGVPTVVDYEKIFSVEGMITDYNIKPGLISRSEDFEIMVQLFEDSPKTIDVSFPAQRQVNLNPGINYLHFLIDGVYGNQFLNINLGKYNIPAYIIGAVPNVVCGNGNCEQGENATNCADDCSGTQESICGNGVIEQGESCEGTNLNSQTCQSQNLGAGNLSCYASGTQYECRFNTTSCENGTAEPPPIIIGESCADVNGTCKFQCRANETRMNATCENLFYICCAAESETQPTSRERIYFKIDPVIIKSTKLFSERFPSYSFRIVNLGNTSINNFSVKYSRAIFAVTGENTLIIEPNSSAVFNLTLRTNATKQIKEVVYVESDGERKYLLVKIDFTMLKNETGTQYFKENESGGVRAYYCSELSGVLCGDNEICEGEKVSSLESEVCCVGNCKSEKTGGSKSWIGYLIAGIVILILLIVFVKYKKVKPETNPIKSIGRGKGL